jgi:hypothetical protein
MQDARQLQELYGIAGCLMLQTRVRERIKLL